MAHELAAKADGSSAMFYLKSEGAPWHGLGTALDGPATAAQAIAAAGLDYEVVSLPMFAQGMVNGVPSGQIPVPSQYLNVRADSMTPLGIVSDKNRVIQNRDSFDFLDSVAATGDLRYHTAGALGVGEKIWLLAKLPGAVRVKGTDDIVDKYLLLYNSHDASSALRCLWTGGRVVCANTVSAALAAGEGTGISIRHTGDIAHKVEEARRCLGLASAYFEAFGEGADFLAGYRPTKEQLEGYFLQLYPNPAKGDPARAKAVRMSLFGLYEVGMGQDMPGVAGTAWAAYNAVTELVDHHVGNDPQRRLESSWFGDGAKIKRQAFDLAVAMASGK